MKKLIFEMFIIFVGLGVAAGLLAGLDERVAVEVLEVEVTSLEGQPQEATQIDMRSLESRQIFELTEPGEPFWGPLAVRLDPKGRPMVIDYGDMTIKLLSADGSHTATLGHGKGQGPGEFISITDVAFLEDRVWVADASNSRLTAFGRDGRLLETLKLATPPYRIASVAADGLLVMHSITNLEVFGVYSRDGTQQRVFGRFLETPWDGIALDRKIARSPDGPFVFSGIYWGVFALYDEQGELQYVRETLHPTPIPKLSRRKRTVRVAPQSEVSALSSSVYGNRLFLLRGTRVGDLLNEQVDVYALDTGDYLHSFMLPQPSSAAFFHGSSMYLTDRASLSKWSYEIQ